MSRNADERSSLPGLPGGTRCAQPQYLGYTSRTLMLNVDTLQAPTAVDLVKSVVRPASARACAAADASPTAAAIGRDAGRLALSTVQVDISCCWTA